MEARDRRREAGTAITKMNTEDLGRHIVAERIKWKRVIDAARLEPQ
jgi:hypothetical protein